MNFTVFLCCILSIKQKNWRNFQKNAIDNLEQGEIIYLDCSHYIHAIEYKKIAEESKRFIESLKYE